MESNLKMKPDDEGPLSLNQTDQEVHQAKDDEDNQYMLMNSIGTISGSPNKGDHMAYTHGSDHWQAQTMWWYCRLINIDFIPVVT